jgi:pyruvate dehydrogenase E1 component
VGAVYDPFVLRGLDALIYGVYNDARFIVAGTPSGVSLAPEGGAHQSTITASVGAELPGLHYVEPAYATEVDWLMCDAMKRLAEPDGESCYLRLSTRPIDQAPFARALERHGSDALRELVLAGGYRLRPALPDGREGVTLVTTGTMAPEALLAASTLEDEGVAATVVHFTSPDRVFRGRNDPSSILYRLIPAEEAHRPIVSVHDASSHSLAWIGSALGTKQISLGVDRFGESGTIADLHEITGISADHIVNAALSCLGDG